MWYASMMINYGTLMGMINDGEKSWVKFATEFGWKLEHDEEKYSTEVGGSWRGFVCWIFGKILE